MVNRLDVAYLHLFFTLLLLTYSNPEMPMFYLFSADLQDGKSGSSTSFLRREAGRTTFGNTDDSLRTGMYTLPTF